MATSNYSDPRAYLQAASARANEDVFGTGEIMDPLRRGMNNRLVFPYTPTLQVSGSAEYEEYTFTHSIYKYNAYTKSTVGEIILTADFTAQTETEAKYMLAAMHFMKSNTKSEFGATSNNPGTPPPVLRFSYMGEYQFKNVPMIIKNYTYVLQPDVDYVPIIVNGQQTKVPVFLNMSVTLDTYYNPKQLRSEFNLTNFKNGSLLDKGYL